VDELRHGGGPAPLAVNQVRLPWGCAVLGPQACRAAVQQAVLVARCNRKAASINALVGLSSPLYLLTSPHCHPPTRRLQGEATNPIDVAHNAERAGQLGDPTQARIYEAEVRRAPGLTEMCSTAQQLMARLQCWRCSTPLLH
jgi:hypothetical protein